MTIVAPAGASVYAAIKVYLSEKFSILEIVLICVLLILILAIIIINVWNHVSYKSYRYPWKKIRTSYNYEILNKTISYKRDDSDILHYCRTITIKCRSNRLNYAFDKYIWTGAQENPIKIIPVTGVFKIKDKSRIGIWHYFLLELENHLEKGETRELSYKWPDIDNCKKSSPFFSASTDDPTKKVSLILELGPEYANQEIICEEFRAIESDYPISKKVERLDAQGAYTWNVPRVKRFRHYRIRWSWTQGQPATEIE